MEEPSVDSKDQIDPLFSTQQNLNETETPLRDFQSENNSEDEGEKSPNTKISTNVVSPSGVSPSPFSPIQAKEPLKEEDIIRDDDLKEDLLDQDFYVTKTQDHRDVNDLAEIPAQPVISIQPRRSQDTSNLSFTVSEKQIAQSYAEEVTNKSVMVYNKEKVGLIGDFRLRSPSYWTQTS